MMDRFDEEKFKQQLSQALEQVQTILDTTRNLKVPHDVSHSYNDKYLLAEYITATSTASLLTFFDALGLNGAALKTIRTWPSKRSVTLRLAGKTTCVFAHKKERKIESPALVTERIGGILGRLSPRRTKTEKIITKVTDYFWKFRIEYELFAFSGNNPDKTRLVLRNSKARTLIMTATDAAPQLSASTFGPIDVDLTWFFKHLDDSNSNVQFSIDRSHKRCHTPRRNTDVNQAFKFFRNLSNWANNVSSYFRNTLFPLQGDQALDLSSVNSNNIFVPMIPLFDANPPAQPSTPERPPERRLSKAKSSSGLLPAIRISSGVAGEGPVPVTINDLDVFFSEQQRTLLEKLNLMSKLFPTSDLITPTHTQLVVLMEHCKDITQRFANALNYIEKLLRQQLIAAIGKKLTPLEFGQYMTFHYRKLFKPEYEPQLFCFAIRRPMYAPEGVISIDASPNDGSISQPISTLVRIDPAITPMKFPLNAASSVSFFGERYLHTWVRHEFSDRSGIKLSFSARARQFSSFIVLLGRISAMDSFEPTHGMIVQNKDSFEIPLDLETIPSAKAFKKAIQSLSVEQQAFASAYRSMQLGQTLFAICIIQIKPQLEKLLNLPDGSLTKEIELCQQLQELFITYQIPSDLLTYDDDLDAPVQFKLAVVKSHVNNMLTMIENTKLRQLEEKKEERRFEAVDDLVIPEITLYNDYNECENEQILCDDFFDYMECKPQMSFSEDDCMNAPGSGYAASDILSKCNEMAIPDVDISLPVAASVPVPATEISLPAAESVSVPVEPSPTPVAEKPKPPNEQQEPSDVELTEEFDYTTIPTKIDKDLERLDPDGAVRPTIIHLGEKWQKTSQRSLLSEPSTKSFSNDDQETERNRTFDFLDALTRSGVLSVDQASLHVVLAATHCFDKSLMNTLVKQNINPIEKVERSSLIIASTIHQVSPSEMIKEEHLARVQNVSPGLFS